MQNNEQSNVIKNYCLRKINPHLTDHTKQTEYSNKGYNSLPVAMESVSLPLSLV